MKQEQWSLIKAPIELSHTEWLAEKPKEENGYLFYPQMMELESITENFSDVSMSKNIGIVGDRGAGKTSLVKTFENYLKANDYYVFDIVDPLVFEQRLSILEILVSNIYNIICKPIDNKDSYDGDSHHARTKILDDLKKITKTLAKERREDSYFKEKNPPIEVLDEIQNRLSLDKLITDVLKNTLNYLKKSKSSLKDFVLIIDDIDLLNPIISSTLIHDIQKYLDAKLIVVLAYRESQLQLSLLDERIKEYNNLLHHQSDTLNEPDIITLDELTLQNTNMLNKLVPKSHRIHLFSPKELIDLNMNAILRAVDKDSDNNQNYHKSAKDWIYGTVFERTNLSIKPVDEREETSYFLPTNIRDLLQLAELLESKMQNIKEVESNTIYIYKQNLEKFATYFQERSYEILTPSKANFLKNWMLKDSYQKNYFSYRFLYETFDHPSENDFLQKNDLSRYQPYNIAIGDVYSIIEEYKDSICKEERDFFFVYALKLFYSIELTLLFYKSIDYVRSNEEFNIEEFLEEIQDANGEYEIPVEIEKYLQLVNVRIMPYRFQYYDFRGKDITDEDTVKYLSNNGDSYKSLCEKIIYSEVSAKGDIRKAIEQTIIPFKYRYLYNYELIAPISGITYYFDPFVFCGKLEYFVQSIAKYNKISAPQGELPYIFTSMFHIDMFTRLTYTTRQAGEKGNTGIIHSAMLSAMERFLTNTVLRYRSNRLTHEMLPYFGTYFGQYDDKNQKVEQIYYELPFDKEEQTLFSDFELPTKDKPSGSSDDATKTTKPLGDLTDEDIDNMTSKAVAQLYFEEIKETVVISDVDDYDAVNDAIKHFDAPNTRINPSHRDFLKYFIKKYFPKNRK